MALLVPAVMAALGWAFVSGLFWYEATRQRPMLIEMFRKAGPGPQAQEPSA